MKIKKEKYESLRLELQEFVPQEFVATCWILNLVCNNNYNYIGENKNGNHPLSHADAPHSRTFIAKDETEKAQYDSSWGKMTGKAGSAHNTASQVTLWWYLSPNNGYHVLSQGGNWQVHSHS